MNKELMGQRFPLIKSVLTSVNLNNVASPWQKFLSEYANTPTLCIRTWNSSALVGSAAPLYSTGWSRTHVYDGHKERSHAFYLVLYIWCRLVDCEDVK